MSCLLAPFQASLPTHSLLHNSGICPLHTNNKNYNNTQAFQLIVLVRYLLGLPIPGPVSQHALTLLCMLFVTLLDMVASWLCWNNHVCYTCRLLLPAGWCCCVHCYFSLLSYLQPHNASADSEVQCAAAALTSLLGLLPSGSCVDSSITHKHRGPAQVLSQ